MDSLKTEIALQVQEAIQNHPFGSRSDSVIRVTPRPVKDTITRLEVVIQAPGDTRHFTVSVTEGAVDVG